MVNRYTILLRCLPSAPGVELELTGPGGCGFCPPHTGGAGRAKHSEGKGGGLLIFRGASRILEYGGVWICYVEMLFLLNIGWGPHSGRPTSFLLLVGVGGGDP